MNDGSNGATATGGRFVFSEVVGTGVKFFTTQWPYLVGLSAAGVLAIFVLALLWLLPVIGQLIWLVGFAMLSAAISFAAVSKLRGESPAFPSVMRVASPQRALEILVVAGVVDLMLRAVGLVILISFITTLIALANGFFLLLSPFVLVIVLVAEYIRARLSMAGILSLDISSPDSMPFSRMKESWQLTKGAGIKLVLLSLLNGLAIGVSSLIPLIGTLLIGVPFAYATRSAAYRSLRGEPMTVPESTSAAAERDPQA